MTRPLHAWFENDLIGTFAQADDGRQSFAYAGSWLTSANRFAISLSMPLGTTAFEDRLTRAFFGGLLPDDELRRRLARYLQVSPRNEFALLAEIGRECAGAISLLPIDESPKPATGSARTLTDEQFAELLEELPSRPLLVGKDIRLSLAGAQDKVAVRVIDDRITLPTDGGPTTHIVKVPIPGFDETIDNECFCMQLAAAIGLPTPRVATRVVGATPILLIERFDRLVTDGVIRRLHQEDFCQALGIPPDMKYQAEGGPGLVQMFELLTQHSARPAVDRLLLLEMVLFHFLIGNADAHGKNFSLLIGPHGARLAPVYDALCTLVYPSLSPKLAMKISDRREFADVQPSHWERFARDTGLAPGLVTDRLRRMQKVLPQLARQLVTGSPRFACSAIVASICMQIEQRCRGSAAR